MFTLTTKLVAILAHRMVSIRHYGMTSANMLGVLPSLESTAMGPVHTPPLTIAYLHPKYWPLWIGQALLWLLVQLPYGWQMRLGKALGRFSMRLQPRRVAIAQRNLQLAMPELDEPARAVLLRQNFESVGCAIFETGMAWFWSDQRMRKFMQVEGEEHLRAALAGGHGILLLSCHFLTLELNARMFGLLQAGVGVYRPNDNPVLEFAQVRGRTRSNKYLLDRRDVKGMIKALRQGEALWYAPDHDYGRHASVFVPFFAVQDSATITGTATLARVKGVRVMPCYTLRLPEHAGYRLVLEAPLANFPTGDDITDATLSNQVIERAIRQAPEQYMWLHRRFKTQPDKQSPSRY